MTAPNGLEMFVRRLYGDSAFKEDALKNPDRALAGYNLSNAEKAAAHKLCLRMVTPQGTVAQTVFGFWV